MGRKVPRKRIHDDGSNVVEMFPPQKRKKWSQHDLQSVKAMNHNQADFLEGWFSGNNVCAIGSAGTGKTFLAVYSALCSVLDERDSIQKMVIIRSAVETRKIGHLPGTVEEKQEVYELPYKDVCASLMGREATYQDMKDARKIEFMLTSHIRGLTWDNVVVVIDEAQNMNFHEINSIMTRLGHNSRVIIVGDTKQSDLGGGEKEGLSQAIKVLQQITDITLVPFTSDDIVRSGFVKSWIKACEQL